MYDLYEHAFPTFKYVDNTHFSLLVRINPFKYPKISGKHARWTSMIKGMKDRKLDHEQHQNSGDKHFGSCAGLSVWVYHLAKLSPSYSVKN